MERSNYSIRLVVILRAGGIPALRRLYANELRPHEKVLDNVTIL